MGGCAVIERPDQRADLGGWISGAGRDSGFVVFPDSFPVNNRFRPVLEKGWDYHADGFVVRGVIHAERVFDGTLRGITVDEVAAGGEALNVK
jgi:hypothetical protein